MVPGLGDASDPGVPLTATPSVEAKDRLSPRLEGANGGEGRCGTTGEGSFAPAPIGDGGWPREALGECVGREGREGPEDNGELCLKDGDGECIDGEPEDNVDDLKGCTGLSGGLRIGRAPAASEESCART